MLKLFFPYEYAESVFAIDYAKLQQKGYRGVIFDIDNTLVHHGEDSTPEVDSLMAHIQSLGLKTFLLSNNNDERIRRFCRNIDTPYICLADKPLPGNYCKAVDQMGISRKEAVFVGDQIFTDILGANRSGIPSILVKYLCYPQETKIGIRRNLEKIILFCYRFSGRYRNRIGDIYLQEGEQDALETR